MLLTLFKVEASSTAATANQPKSVAKSVVENAEEKPEPHGKIAAQEKVTQKDVIANDAPSISSNVSQF